MLFYYESKELKYNNCTKKLIIKAKLTIVAKLLNYYYNKICNYSKINSCEKIKNYKRIFIVMQKILIMK